MNLKELVADVSGSTGIGEDSVRRVVKATIVAMSKHMEGDKPMKLQGLGTFMRKPSKKDAEKSRVVFRPWPTAEEKKARKEKKKAKKGAAAE